jgi:hypothetical protein
MKRKRFDADQYADLLVSELDAAHFAKKGDFLHLGRHRDLIAKHFQTALDAAFADGEFVGKHKFLSAERGEADSEGA